jgi:hypothetical protein
MEKHVLFCTSLHHFPSVITMNVENTESKELRHGTFAAVVSHRKDLPTYYAK